MSTVPTRPMLAPQARLRWDRHAGRYLLLAPERGLLLDRNAHAVVALCDGRSTVDEIASVMQREHPDSDLQVIARDVERFLAELAIRGLLA